MPATTQICGLLIIAAAVIAIARRVDVRLALLLAAFAMGGLAGNVPAILKTFFGTLGSEQFVVPICSAMGFAHVLRQTGCDRHLIHFLSRPLLRVRPLLIPGAVLVPFVVNISIISQAGTAVAVGTVLVPLLRSARLSAVTIAAALALGSSLGGEQLNPGAHGGKYDRHHLQGGPSRLRATRGSSLVPSVGRRPSRFLADLPAGGSPRGRQRGSIAGGESGRSGAVPCQSHQGDRPDHPNPAAHDGRPTLLPFRDPGGLARKPWRKPGHVWGPPCGGQHVDRFGSRIANDAAVRRPGRRVIFRRSRLGIHAHHLDHRRRQLLRRRDHEAPP